VHAGGDDRSPLAGLSGLTLQGNLTFQNSTAGSVFLSTESFPQDLLVTDELLPIALLL